MMTPELRDELRALLSYVEGTQASGSLGYQDSGSDEVEDFHYLEFAADPESNFQPEPLEFSLDAYNLLYPLTGEESGGDGFFHEDSLHRAAAHLREPLEDAA